MKSSMRNKTFDRARPAALLLAAALLLTGAAGCEQSPPPPQAEAPPVNVKVQVIQAIRNYRDTVQLPGIVEPNEVVTVSAEVAGRVERLACEEGRPCKAGDQMIFLNTDILKAQHDSATAQAEFAERERQRLERALQRGVATMMEVDTARTQVAAAKASLDLARANLDRATIVAPTDGILNDLPVEVGEYVTPGMAVAEIVDVETVKVVVDVPEHDVKHLRVGMEPKPEISVDVLDEPKLTGEITYISELADPLARTTRVEITVPNPRTDGGPRPLRSGQIVTVVLTRQVLPKAILIPLAAVIPLEDGYRVYVANDDQAYDRTVKLGFFRGNQVQIVGGGLAEGEKLIVSGQRYVAPGQTVRIVQDE